MVEKFRTYLGQFAVFTEAEIDLILSKATMKRLRKRQFLLVEGEVCTLSAWIIQGMLRMFFIDHTGKEHTVEFAVENNFISDRQSQSTGKPSLMNIDALENSEVLLFGFDDVELLIETIPSLAKMARKASINQIGFLQNRILLSLSLSADEKYKVMALHYGELMQRVPQHMIASYLGVTPATLSRVRKKYEQG
jgi:CRP-like cAMP-binding protein